MGAITANVDKKTLELLKICGIGIAFQIQDDILDVTSSSMNSVNLRAQT